MLGKPYAKFHIDLGLGDAVIGDPERLIGDDFLEFAGLAQAVVFAIPKPQQFEFRSDPSHFRMRKRWLAWSRHAGVVASPSAATIKCDGSERAPVQKSSIGVLSPRLMTWVIVDASPITATPLASGQVWRLD